MKKERVEVYVSGLQKRELEFIANELEMPITELARNIFEEYLQVYYEKEKKEREIRENKLINKKNQQI